MPSMSNANLFMRCGQFLCGPDHRWKEQFAALLKVKANTVDNMAKATSRVPPAMWREIAAYIQDREREAPTLRGAALLAADQGDQPLPRFAMEVPISPPMVGAGVQLTPKAVAEINRRFANLREGHDYKGCIFEAPSMAKMVVRIPRTLSREAVEGLGFWLEDQLRNLSGGAFSIDPLRTSNFGSDR